MAYTNPEFQARSFVLVGDNRSLSTATASGAISNTAVIDLPKFIRRTAVNAIRLKVKTIPNAASTALVLSALNGTSTFGTAVLTTATLGQTVDFVITTASLSTFTAGGQPTMSLTGTATASAAANGAYDVFYEQRELPS